MAEEMVERVDEEGKTLGEVPRSRAHADPRLLHRVVHLLVLNRSGDLLLQKRSMAKDVAPGRWDTSVGGHVAPGEGVREALRREMREELGIEGEPEATYDWTWRGERESELVHSFLLVHEGPFLFPAEEIEEVAFWTVAEVEAALGGAAFSRQFEEEFRRYREWRGGRE